MLFIDDLLLLLDGFQLLLRTHHKQGDEVLISYTENVAFVRIRHLPWNSADNFRHRLLKLIRDKTEPRHVLFSPLPKIIRHRPYLAKDPQRTLRDRSSVSLAVLERLIEITNVCLQLAI